jgi:hypothetical protein
MRAWPLSSYQLGSLAFTVGTAVWGAQSWITAGALDPAAAAYAIGCIYFLRDAFAPSPQRTLLSAYRLGTVAYAIGTLVWGVQVYRDTRRIDLAAVTYGIGCMYFMLDAFRSKSPLRSADPAPTRRGPARLRLTSQQLGAVAFFVGTVIWGLTGGVSIPVAAYGLGCLFFLRDAFRQL